MRSGEQALRLFVATIHIEKSFGAHQLLVRRAGGRRLATMAAGLLGCAIGLVCDRWGYGPGC